MNWQLGKCGRAVRFCSSKQCSRMCRLQIHVIDFPKLRFHMDDIFICIYIIHMVYIYIFIEAWNYTDIFGKYPTVGSTSVPFLASQDINNDLTSGSKSGDPGDQYRL